GAADAKQGVFAQAHDPGEQQLAGGGEGRLGEGRRQGIDDRPQRGYHGPHGRISLPTASATVRVGASSLVFHLANLLPSVQTFRKTCESSAVKNSPGSSAGSGGRSGSGCGPSLPTGSWPTTASGAPCRKRKPGRRRKGPWPSSRTTTATWPGAGTGSTTS